LIVNFDKFRLAKTTFELRKEMNILPPDSKFSYQNIERKNKRFTPLIVPKSLESALPFVSKDKIRENRLQAAELKQKNSLVKTIQTSKEKKAQYLIHRLKTIKKEKLKLKKRKEESKKKWKSKWDQGMRRKIIKKNDQKKFYPQKRKNN
jgi:ribosome biogenesis protein BMS1